MITKTRQAANTVGIRGLVFNDRLKDGRRSLKVTHWSHGQYYECAEILRRQGCKVVIKDMAAFNNYYSRCFSGYRLIVTE